MSSMCGRGIELAGFMVQMAANRLHCLVAARSAPAGAEPVDGELVDRTALTDPEHTQVAVLCQLDGRQGGDVTVGDSRMPAATIMRIARRGLLVSDAVVVITHMYPWVSAEQVAVLARLVADLDCRDVDDEAPIETGVEELPLGEQIETPDELELRAVDGVIVEAADQHVVRLDPAIDEVGAFLVYPVVVRYVPGGGA